MKRSLKNSCCLKREMNNTSCPADNTALAAATVASESKRPSSLIDYSKPAKNHFRHCTSQRSTGTQRRLSSSHNSACRTKTASWLKASNLRMNACKHEQTSSRSDEMVCFRMRHGVCALQELPEDEPSSTFEDDKQPLDVDTCDQETTTSDSQVKRPVRRRSILHTSVQSPERTSPKSASYQEKLNSVVDPKTLQALLHTQDSRCKKKSNRALKLEGFFAKESDNDESRSSLARALSADGANSVLSDMQRASRSRYHMLTPTDNALRRIHSDDADALKALQHFLKPPTRNVNHHIIIKPTTPQQSRTAPSRSVSAQVQPVSPKRSIPSRSKSSSLDLNNIHFSRPSPKQKESLCAQRLRFPSR